MQFYGEHLDIGGVIITTKKLDDDRLQVFATYRDIVLNTICYYRWIVPVSLLLAANARNANRCACCGSIK
jgi:hypothetical protein